jgi:hypothetical protein
VARTDQPSHFDVDQANEETEVIILTP